MKVSYNWLLDYLPVNVSAQELADILTSIGLEVEELYEWESVRGGLSGLVIGEVKEVVKHPNADKLSLTKVSVGNGNLLSIVCGAPNVVAGQRVIVAPVDTTIHPISGEPFTIKKAKIRGEHSEGMICAEDEIGLGHEHQGIIVLNGDAPVGKPAADYIGVVRDWVFDIAVTPNRADAMSHIGVARDLAAHFSFHRGERNLLKHPTHELFNEGTSSPIRVTVEDAQACPRYSGLTIENITVSTSPQWMQNRLKAIDVRPINNVVDVTNYILHEMGQPLHAFDADHIRGSNVIVRTLNEATPFTTLDEQDRKLSAQDLMICDAKGGMCIAGVFGGIGSGVTEKTKRVFLESAHFDPMSVRKTSFRHNLRTEAAMRFEKGTDPNITVAALERAAHLMKQVAPDVTFSGIVDVYPKPATPRKVQATYHVMDRLIGEPVSKTSASPILAGLGMNVTESADGIAVEVPTWKRDIEHVADLVEEVLRIYGMDRIGIPDRFVTAISNQSNENYKLKEVVGDWLSAQGFHEITSLSMTNEKYYSASDALVGLINPLSSESRVLRGTMLYSGLECIARNINYRELDLRLFEFGKTYIGVGEGYSESEQLSLFLTGNETPESWEMRQKEVRLSTVKLCASRVIELLGLHSDAEELQPSGGLSLLSQGQALASFGEVNRKELKVFDIKQPVYWAEINWELCRDLASSVQRKFTDLPRFPSIRRDLAIILGEDTPYAEVEKAARSNAGQHLREVRLFDIYRDEKIGQGKKSYAMSFIFRDDTRTLTDDDADRAIEGIIKAIEKDLGATIRRT